MQKIEPNYWAFCANPKLYKIEQAVHELSEDSWQVPRGNVRRGDRAIIWKTKGNDKHRGIVALAEVLTDVVPDKPLHPEYWLDFDSTDKVINRVKIRYIVPPTLPLWENSADLNVLSELSVARATGGTIFHVTADQWNAIMSAIGGWPSTPPEIADF